MAARHSAADRNATGSPKGFRLCAAGPEITRLVMMYDSRGATEHLALPVRELQVNDSSLSTAEAEVPFAHLVFMGKALARHALVRVLSTPVLRKHFSSENAMLAFWRRDDATVRREWGDALPLAELMKRFDATRARNDLEGARVHRGDERSIMAKAPDAFRSGEPF